MTAPTHAGKTALITGGTAGIGFHIAAALARLGTWACSHGNAAAASAVVMS